MAALALGTVQLGEAYGRHPELLPSAEAAVALLLEAADPARGVASFDTASNYGVAEERIGLAVRQLPATQPRWPEVVTKIDEVADASSAAELEEVVDRSVALSQRRLGGVASLDCCCIHNFGMWEAHSGAAWNRLCYHRDVLGTVGRCGVSVATFEEALTCLADPTVQHIQLPVNLLDRRWRQLRSVEEDPSGREGSTFDEIITRAVQERGVTVHARSCFLQGTLLNDAPLWPEWAVAEGWAQRVLEPLDRLVEELGRTSRADLCIAWVRSLPWVTHVLVGMRSLEQLRANVRLFDNQISPPLSHAELALVEAQLPAVSERLISPWLWSDAAWAKATAAEAPKL
jgi:aryl-alcohol dehydrogenase-like predicted oxidoreductase